MFSPRTAICWAGCRLMLFGLGRIVSMPIVSILAFCIRAETRADSSAVGGAVFPERFAFGFFLAATSTSSTQEGCRRHARAHDVDSRFTRPQHRQPSWLSGRPKGRSPEATRRGRLPKPET